MSNDYAAEMMGGAVAEAVRVAVEAVRALNAVATARLRGDLDATEHALLDARARLDAVADALGLPAEWDAEWGDRIAAERARREAAEAECARLRAALADADLILEERERQLTEALTTLARERTRCAVVCREVADIYRRSGCACAECEGRRDGARECAEEIERGKVDL